MLGVGRASRAALLLALALSASASAQEQRDEAGNVQLSIPDCAGIPGSQITSLVELELATRRGDASAIAAATPIRASVLCDATRATITVEDARRPSPLVLALELGDTEPEARPRYLALAVAELIATSRLEPDEPRPPPAPAPAPAPAAEPARAAPEPHARRLDLFLEAGAARAFEPALFAPALALGLTRHWAPFSLSGEVAFERGQTSTPDARITAQDLALSIIPAWHPIDDGIDLALGFGARAGYVWLAASARNSQLVGRDLSGLFLAPIASTSLTVRIAQSLAPRIALEAGYVVKPVRGTDADHASLLALRGVWLGALLGVAWSPY